MKRIGVMVIVAALAVCATAQKSKSSARSTEAPPAENASTRGLSLEQKLGQIFLAGWPEWGVPDAWHAVLGDGGIGGIALTPGGNYLIADELDAFVDTARKANAAPQPLLFAAPCEGGTHVLLSAVYGGASAPEAAALGARGNMGAIRETFAQLGQDLRAHGVQLAIGPLLGLTAPGAALSTEVRAFGSDPAHVAECAAAAVAGIESAGVMAAPMAYPGVAGFTKPTGLDMETSVTHDAIGAAAVKAGASAMFAGATRVTTWDRESMAAQSAEILGNRLRGQHGFQGLIVSPDLNSPEMLAGTTPERAAVAALKAGCDLLYVYGSDIHAVAIRKQAIRDAIKSGELPEARLNDAVRRIIDAKEKSGAGGKPAKGKGRGGDTPGAQNGVVIVRDADKQLPLRAVSTKYLVVAPGVELRDKDGSRILAGTTLGAAVRGIVRDAQELRIDLDPTNAQEQHALASAQNADVIIIGTLLAHTHPMQAKLITALQKIGKPVVIVGLGDPSGVEAYTDAPVLVLSNGFSPAALRAAAAVLFGEQKAGGKLPAPIGRLFPAGQASQ